MAEMKVELKIEKNIPVRQSSYSKGFSAVLRKLQKGDSVVLPTTMSSAGSLSRQILGKGNSSCATEKNGIRVWRIK